MKLTANYGFKKPEGHEFVDNDDLNYNTDVMDTQLKKLNDGKLDDVYGTVTGTNTLVMSVNNVKSYRVGMLVAFKNTTANTGASTLNINGLGAKPIIKNGGTPLTSGNLKAGGVYTVRYDGSNFILQGEGGEYGNATASDVLAGKTIGTEQGIVTGTMVNRGAVTQAINAGGSYTIPAGFHNGSGKITGNNLASQTAGNVDASWIVKDGVAWCNGQKLVGTIPRKPAQTYTPTTVNQNIGEGQYLNGVQTILGDVDLIAANIISGKNIFGVAGTATATSLGGKRFASGSNPGYATDGFVTVTGLAFQPALVMLRDTMASTETEWFTVYASKSLFGGSSDVDFFIRTTDDSYTAETTITSNGFSSRINIGGNSGSTTKWIAIG